MKTNPPDVRLTCISDAEPAIKKHMDKIGLEAGRPQLFTEVKEACLNKRAFLFMAPGTEGFFVLKPLPEKAIKVWVAYCQQPNAVLNYQPVIINLCKKIGGEAMEFETALPALERFMPRHGWQKAYTVWRQKL